MHSPIGKRPRGGFTLLEMMIVVLVLGILMAIALPNWVRAHEQSSRRSCLSNLRQMEQAKERFAIEQRKPQGGAMAWADLVPAYLRQQPDCPAGGEYSLEAIGSPPECTVSGHEMR